MPTWIESMSRAGFLLAFSPTSPVSVPSLPSQAPLPAFSTSFSSPLTSTDVPFAESSESSASCPQKHDLLRGRPLRDRPLLPSYSVADPLFLETVIPSLWIAEAFGLTPAPSPLQPCAPGAPAFRRPLPRYACSLALLAVDGLLRFKSRWAAPETKSQK